MRLLAVLILCAVQGFGGTRYYVKNGGNNGLSGTSDANAWETVAEVNSVAFVAGDTISFKRGDTWEESLTLASSGNGSSGNRIVVNYYGTGAKPHITQLLNVSGAMTSGNWSDDDGGGPGNIWTFANSVSFRWRVILSENAYGHADGNANINSRFRWFISGSTLKVYATSNPASFYSSIKMPSSSNTIYLNGKDYITFRGLKISGGLKSVLAVGSDYITFDSCNIGNYANEPAIMTGNSSNGSEPCHYWTFTADTIDRIDTVKYTFNPGSQTGFSAYNGWGDGIQVKDGDNGTIQYCVFRDLRHGSINLDAEVNGQSTSNWIVERNEFYSRSDYNRPFDIHTYDHQTTGTIFRFNYIHNMTVWSAVMEISGVNGQYYYNIIDTTYTPSWASGAERHTAAFEPFGGGNRIGKNTLIANNTIMNAAGPAFNFTQYNQDIIYFDSVKIYNNILYNNGTDNSVFYSAGIGTYAHNYGLELRHTWTYTHFRGDIRNNYIYSTFTPADSSIMHPIGENDPRITVLSYNGSDAEWETISGNTWTNTSIGTDHKIGSGSSAVNAGIDWGHTGTDFFGNAISGNPDVGVHEYTAAGTLTITTDCPVASGTVNAVYSENIAYATGGIPPYTWSEGNPAFYGVDGLPSGLSISSAGMLTGTPTEAGTFTFKIKVTDNEVMSNVKTCSITINSATSSPRALILLR